MADIRYTEDHEWISVEGKVGTIGITDYAQNQLGDVVYVELPEVGREVAKGDETAVVESVKAASEIYAPVGGKVTAVNQALEENYGLVNEDAAGAGWFMKLELSDPAELDGLMDEAAYAEFVKSLG
ncbi:glycine cleavage system protein GcvH [Oceanibacterium hippocampi]|uniref:Glycine cleavage system H protein n=1 Tax=Oceanibacterium hippocampi TaxID=745714 RepID=A0A1Y5S8A8_9PROT|nr:glycine cleavage system protein GcvH [Oceanibacterium hippocampi]SLN33747.1 Glycine cleavage system H protein [Oceanibacterium hippocampi]